MSLLRAGFARRLKAAGARRGSPAALLALAGAMVAACAWAPRAWVQANLGGRMPAGSGQQPRAATATSGGAPTVPLATFDGTPATTHTWKEMNDPVMGGKSVGTTSVEGGMLVFDGTVAIVPSLNAPGFITSQVSDGFFHKGFPDVSKCKGVSLNLKSSTDFKGYRFCFGNKHARGGKFFAYGFKAHFDAPVGEFGTVDIPFDEFTDFWDDATGNPIKTCQESAENCPDAATLQNMKTMAFWGEGVEGKVHLEVKSVSAYGCAGSAEVVV